MVMVLELAGMKLTVPALGVKTPLTVSGVDVPVRLRVKVLKSNV